MLRGAPGDCPQPPRLRDTLRLAGEFLPLHQRCRQILVDNKEELNRLPNA